MSSIDRGTVLQQLDRLFSEGTLAGLGDGQLLERYLTRRDHAAFEALVEVHGPMVLGLCRRFLRDPRDIEDAFQATFLVLVRKAPGIRDGSLLSNWLYGVALRVATRARANLLRRRGREQAIGDAEFAAEPESHEVLGLGPVLDQELSRLPAKYRAPLVLCYLRGQTHDQAANELQCPVGTVRSRMARGRDLLKRRLTRRGCAPSAAIFGPALDVPAHLLTEAVPARLVAATVEGALAIGSSHTIQAGAATASVLALTQGVVISMKFTQFKWIGLALLATGLSAGGAVVVAAVSARDAGTGGDPRVAARAVADPFQEAGKAAAGSQTSVSTSTSSSATDPSKTTEERLRRLEEQIDRVYEMAGVLREGETSGMPANASTLDRLEAKLAALLSRHGIPVEGSGGSAGAGISTAAGTTAETIGNVASTGSATSTTSTRSAGASSVTKVRDVEPRRAVDGSNARIRELEAGLHAAMRQSARDEDLHRRNMISEQEAQEARAKVDSMFASLRGLDDDFADELELAKLVVKRKKAELDEATALKEVAMSVTARNGRLIQRQPGVVAAEDVAKAEAEVRSAAAHERAKAVDLEEAELQCRKLTRWRARIDIVLESTKIH